MCIELSSLQTTATSCVLSLKVELQCPPCQLPFTGQDSYGSDVLAPYHRMSGSSIYVSADSAPGARVCPPAGRPQLLLGPSSQQRPLAAGRLRAAGLRPEVLTGLPAFSGASSRLGGAEKCAIVFFLCLVCALLPPGKRSPLLRIPRTGSHPPAAPGPAAPRTAFPPGRSRCPGLSPSSWPGTRPRSPASTGLERGARFTPDRPRVLSSPSLPFDSCEQGLDPAGMVTSAS